MKNILTKYLEKRKRVIYDRIFEEPYLERYYVLFKNRKKWFPFNVFVHKFLKSDPDEVHDHPWMYFTFILKGGYYEITEKGKFWRPPGHFRISPARSYHRIELKPGVTAWSLFIPFVRIRKWGFKVNGNWMESEEYFDWKIAQNHG